MEQTVGSHNITVQGYNPNNLTTVELNYLRNYIGKSEGLSKNSKENEVINSKPISREGIPILALAGQISQTYTLPKPLYSNQEENTVRGWGQRAKSIRQ